MRNQRTNSSRLVKIFIPAESERGENPNERTHGHAKESNNLSSKMVLIALSPVGMPRAAECKRYYTSYSGTEKAMCCLGGETDAR